MSVIGEVRDRIESLEKSGKTPAKVRLDRESYNEVRDEVRETSRGSIGGPTEIMSIPVVIDGRVDGVSVLSERSLETLEG